ncbi:hypothetical protein EF902_13585 [Streptomyces sp. WAC05858]|nr:hypothetical protein EF902_13585 [Streptomyces sp. WAC05858]
MAKGSSSKYSQLTPSLIPRAIATPGHTPHHTSYALEEDGRAVAVFTGGSAPGARPPRTCRRP